MTYYLIDINNIDKFNFDNLIIGKEIEINESKSKYYIYYNPTNESPKEIYIKIPSVRLIYALADHKYNQLNIPLYPMYDNLHKVTKFIKKMEQYFINKLSKKNEDIQFNNIINKKKLINFIKTNIDDNKIKITSNLNTKINLNDFKLNSEIEMVIKFEYIWNKNNTYGISSTLYQIKYLGIPTQLNIDLIDFIDEPVYNPIINIPPPPNMIIKSSISKLPPQIFKIDPTELLSTKKNLKSIKK
jgi:hypothetical protein